MTLFEINKAILDFQFEVDEETGELLNAQALDDLQMARDEKIENVGLWIKNLNAEAAAVKAEKDAMAHRQKMLERKAESLKGYLAYALKGEKFSTPKIAMSFRKSESVDILPGAEIPEQYLKVKTITEPDKIGLKKALKEGAQFDGVTLNVKQNLQIK